MNGRVVSFSTNRAGGAILADQGRLFDFTIAGVLAYDVTRLSAGQVVHFEADSGSPPKAVNVSILPPVSVHYSEERYRELRRLRYVGFEQSRNIRTYRFERVAPGELTEKFAVDTDMVLFHRHKVSLQDGPTLCLHLLTEALDRDSAAAGNSYSATEQHMLTFLASRPGPASKSGAKSYQFQR